jgi:hypothetical protein|tara:strand:+ start:27967 stop:28965 length:999 start_codon:yes stop_codon:yes gene_type:complete
MKIAFVLTVKNESRLLRNNLRYHQAIGAAHIFVYFDGSTDDGKDTIKDLAYVTILESVAAKKFEHLPFLEKFTSQAIEHHTARQCLNTYDAKLRALEKGCDWLISIDADELVCPNFDAHQSLNEFFGGIDQAVSVIRFYTFEAIQRKQQYENVFAEETLFKTTHTYKSKFQKIWKTLEDPFEKRPFKTSYWYGHHLGKAAIRTSSHVIPKNVHAYQRVDGSNPRKLQKGNVLHYHAYDSDDFLKKFTNFSKHPDVFLSGNKVKPLKLLLRNIVNSKELCQEYKEKYYKNYLMFTEREVVKLKKNRYLFFLKRNKAPLRTIMVPNQIFKRLNS